MPKRHEADADDHVEDLQVPEREADDVKGGAAAKLAAEGTEPAAIWEPATKQTRQSSVVNDL